MVRAQSKYYLRIALIIQSVRASRRIRPIRIALHAIFLVKKKPPLICTLLLLIQKRLGDLCPMVFERTFSSSKRNDNTLLTDKVIDNHDTSKSMDLSEPINMINKRHVTRIFTKISKKQ